MQVSLEGFSSLSLLTVATLEAAEHNAAWFPVYRMGHLQVKENFPFLLPS